MKYAARFLLLFCCVAAHSQTSSTMATETLGPEESNLHPRVQDFFILAGTMDHASSLNGGSGSFDWVHLDGQDRTYTAGVSVNSQNDSRWAFGKGGAAFPLTARAIFQGLASIGGGRAAGTGFAYQIYGGELTYQEARSLHLRLGLEYLKIGETNGLLFKPGVTWTPARFVTANLKYIRSGGGNFSTEIVSARLDVTTGRAGILGGFAAGRSIPEAANVVVGTLSQDTNLREGFFGFHFPLPGAEFTAVSDFLNLGSTRKRSFTFSVKMPMQRRSPTNDEE